MAYQIFAILNFWLKHMSLNRSHKQIFQYNCYKKLSALYIQYRAIQSSNNVKFYQKINIILTYQDFCFSIRIYRLVTPRIFLSCMALTVMALNRSEDNGA